MKAMYIVHIIYYYETFNKRTDTYIFDTLIEAIDKVRKTVVEEENVKDWDSAGTSDLIVDLYGTADDHSIGIDIQLGYKIEEP